MDTHVSARMSARKSVCMSELMFMIHMSVRTYLAHVCAHVGTPIYTHVCALAGSCICVHVRAHAVRLHTCAHAHAHECVHVHICVHVGTAR